MNRRIPRIGAAIVTASVFIFALCLMADYSFGSYLVCMFLPIGYIMTAAGFQNESAQDKRVAADVGMVFCTIYAALIFLVYFAQTTTIRVEELSEQAVRILDFQQGGLLFNYDLLGYGMMALSTLFIGLSMDTKSKGDRWLKCLVMVHGIFFIGCFVLPMTGVFANMSDSGAGSGGVIALLCWCIYFLLIGILSFLHFSDRVQ